MNKNIKDEFWRQYYDPNKISGISLGLGSPPKAKPALIVYIYKAEDIPKLNLPEFFQGMEVIPKLMHPGSIPPGGFRS